MKRSLLLIAVISFSSFCLEVKADFGNAEFPLGTFQNSPKNYHDAWCRSIKNQCRIRFQGPVMWVEGLKEEEQLPGKEQEPSEKEIIEIPEEFKEKYAITFDYNDGRHRFIYYREKGLPEGQSFKGEILMEGDTKADQSTWELIYKKEQARDKHLNPYENSPIPDGSEKTSRLL